MTENINLLNEVRLLCEWIAETPHQRGSINGKASQVLHKISQELADRAQRQAVPQKSMMAGMIDAAMVEMKNIHPPLRRSDCERLIRAALSASPTPPASTEAQLPTAEPIGNFTLPAIGQPWPGIDGIYAGISRGEDGEPDAHLVLLNAQSEDVMSWDAAVEWAQTLGDGARLPTRFEGALLYAHVRDKLDTSRWHWTGTQYSSDFAWYQDFSYGDQDDDGKKAELRARAVRRLNAQSFNPSKGVQGTTAPQKGPRLVGYAECRCILYKYCDGTCRPVFAEPVALERAKVLYANSPYAYCGTQPVPWDKAPLLTKLEFIDKAKATLGAQAQDTDGGKEDQRG